MTKALFMLLMCLGAHVAHCQQAGLDSITKKFDVYRRQALQEKLYVHLDQNFYFTGETLWFSIYYVDGSFHKPLNVSKVAYVEILDRNNAPMLQVKVELSNGVGKGSAFLPATIPSGNYTLRAYTQWMKNFDAGFFFRQEITIVNPFTKPETETSRSAADHRITFFPEGGQLVYGLPGQVAFTLTDISGNGIHRTGAIINQQNDTIVTFRPHRFGMGRFSFTPAAGQTYRAVVKDRNGRPVVHALPEIRDTGYAMAVTENNGQVRISVSSQFNGTNPAFVYLFAHSRNVVIRAEMKTLNARQCEFMIDRNSLREGVNHFTILDEAQRPVCERLYFRQPSPALAIRANTDQPQYGTRRKVTLQLQSGLRGQPVPANLSVAIAKVDSLSSHDTHDIFSYLMLSSDLQGKVELPAYYFTPNDADVALATDNLMLTHGWRKFNWDKILSSDLTFAHIPEYRGHIVRASATRASDTTKGRVLTYLAVPGKQVRFRGARSNARGELLFDVGLLTGQHKMLMLTSPDQSGNARLEVKNPFSAEPAAGVSPFRIPAGAEKKFLERSIAMQVQDIFYEETATQVTQPVSDTLAFYGKADETYYLDRYTRFPVMEEVMREYVPGVFVRKRKDGFHFIVIDATNGGVFSADPMILLDGVPLFDADRIMEVDPRKVKKLEVVKRRYHLGPLSMPGVVSYTTYQGDIAGVEMDPGSISLNYEALQQYREFSSPHYTNQQQFGSRMPDRRYLVYWAPQVTTGADGTCTLEFYTSDVTGTFQVSVQGLATSGDAGSTVQTFTVR